MKNIKKDKVNKEISMISYFIRIFKPIQDKNFISEFGPLTKRFISITFFATFFFLGSSLPSRAQTYVYSQTDLVGHYLTSESEVTETWEIGNLISFDWNDDRQIRRVYYHLYKSLEANSIPDTVTVNIWRTCPASNGQQAGICGSNGAELMYSFTSSPNLAPGTSSQISVDLPSPLQIERGNIFDNNPFYISFSTNDPANLGIGMGEDDPPFGAGYKENPFASICGVVQTPACNQDFDGVNNLYLQIVAVRDPDKYLGISLSNIGNGPASATITAEDAYIGDAYFFPTQSISLSKYTFTCEDIGENTIYLTITFFNGVVKTYPVTVIVYDRHGITYSSNSPICSDEQLELSAVDGITGPFTYEWSGYGDFGNSEFTATPTVEGAASGDYMVTATNGCGVEETFTISVIVDPTTTATISNNGPICSNDPLELSVQPTGLGPFTYSWSGAGQSWINGNTNLPSVFGALSGDYTVTITNKCGEESTYTTSVIVKPLPTASATNNGPICPSDALELTVQPIGEEPFTYSWSGQGDSWLNQNTATPTVNGASSGIYTVTVTDACGLVTSTSTTLDIHPPVMPIASSNSPLCPGENIELSVETNGEGPFSYNWIGPGHSWGGANTATPTVSGPVSGDYYVTVTGPCETVVASTSVMVEDITPPIANCKNLLIEIVGVNVTLTAEDVNNQSSDECSIQTLLLDGASYVVLDDSDLGLNNLTLTVTDNSGNSSTCESVITVVPDLCPGSDGIDSDNGGLPDDCDCSPNDDFNDKIFLNRDVNSGMDFDGIDDYLSTPNAPLFNPSATSSISFEAWIKPDLTKESNTIISKGDGGNGQTAYILETNYSNLRFFLGNSAGSGTWFTADTQLLPNVWTHVAASYNHTNSTVIFYVNGSFSNNEPFSFTPYSADTELFFIGRQGYLCGCNYYKGQMDEVRVWSSDYNSLIRSYKDKELRGGEQSLLAYYSFNDGVPGGNNNNRTITKDYSPNGHHASLSSMAKNGPTSNWVNDDLALAVINTETLDLCLTCPNVQNGGMHFDGVNSFLEVDRDPVFSPSLTSSFTFEAWVNIIGQNRHTIISKGSGTGGENSYIFNISNFQQFQGKIGLYIGDGTQGTWIYSDSGVLEGNGWTHVAVVYDHVTNTFTFYKNGIADGQRTIPHGFYSGSYPLLVGQQGSVTQSHKFLGKMDEVRIWKKARTAAEISHYMNQKLYGGEEALSAYYNFDDGTPWGDNTGRSYVADVSLNGHEASLYGFAKTGVTSNWVDGPNNNSLPTNVAMDFDFIDDYISIANDQSLIPTASNAVTFEAWIGFIPSSAANIITASGVSPNNNHQISIENNKLQVSGSGVAPLLSNQELSYSNGWTHIAVVFDQTETKLYINGLLDNTRVETLASTNLGHPITLGSAVNADSYYGAMDDVRYWGYARSQEEIQEAMYQELSGKEPGLSAYYNFNNGIPSGDNTGLAIVPDVSGHGHDGTVNGFARTGGASNWTASPFNFGDLDDDGIPDFCDKCVFAKVLVLYETLWKSVYRARESITLGNGMTLPVGKDLTFETPMLMMSDHIQTAAGTEIMVTPFVCADGND
ncbi:LamG domain-containing protein [Portibacter lacus]|uniref:LamG-like jellyroll fold domain-containing protein n=1 Tax=Portibacter lacus TaxID=1099794 RepID=A0AA37WFZ2_9BACT|nr:LamG domain-containing protein [Portibacter lacus]GLR17460.1 hypothetical protein GCM10007940_20750 [Portibacter lacus]